MDKSCQNGRIARSVNLAACGSFHFRHYVRYLAEAGVLNRFYYSHKRSTDAIELGLRAEQAVNLFAKEYLTHAHLRLISHRFGNLAFPIYQRIWERQAISRWVDSDIAHILVHGSARQLIAHARQRGSFVIGEPVNAHPRFVQQLMREEYDRLGLPLNSVSELNNGQRAMLEEVASVDVLLVPSRFVAESYQAHGIFPKKLVVEPYGTDLSRFQPGPRPDDNIFRVVCVSQISPRKGHIDLIAAWESLNLPQAELVLIGAMTPEMERVLASKRHLFSYRGRIPHAELSREFHRADVVVLPSIEDGFSYVPLEAMACGIPVIVSSNAGVSELIREGETGFVVPIRSPGVIAERIQALYECRERCTSMGQTASNMIRSGHSWSDYAERVIAHYRELPPALVRSDKKHELAAGRSFIPQLRDAEAQ